MKWPKENDIDSITALEKILSHVRGMDIHPVAVTVAQVTFLLAILPLMKDTQFRTALSVPVYLGDALQWWVDRPSEDTPQDDWVASTHEHGFACYRTRNASW